ncbi:unnamed protein product [Parnassius mnemosyne]|uniref:BPTI/Kunitz inhibitor domain-containing protein n=1 Tax=Parnassius mnemosyne TaxID=213953 RepID=A0AAV1LLH5_9NEOP
MNFGMHFHVYFTFLLAVLVLYVAKGTLCDQPMTSAKMREATIPKPTIAFRRAVAVDEKENNLTNTNLSNSSARRNSLTDLWSWDYWCQLQPKTGNCSNNVMRYYYDIEVAQCVNFTYSGCGGNNNNFDSKVNCEKNCDDATYMSLKEEMPNFCSLQPDPGTCLSLRTKYYYDINNRECKDFQYGGCGGNRNKFDTKQSCLQECSGS